MNGSRAAQLVWSAPAEPAVHDEVLFESERTRVIRTRLPGSQASCVLKQPRGPHAAARLEHERRILQRLAGSEGAVRLAEGPQPDDALALEDHPGASLAKVIGTERLGTESLLTIAAQLARAVAAVHRCGVLHKDINPANIVLSGVERQPLLIDFHLASTFAEEQPGFTHHREIVGTLAYLAPEQTSRTGRSVDQRADLYALGATLYELSTGRLPFEEEDPLQLIHAHLARLPVPPTHLNPQLPRALSDIVMRLLEKEPDRRYQSAQGLAHDLARVRDDWLQGRDQPFTLGERDFALRLSPPSRLVGREAEIAAMRQAFAEALHGRRRAVLVAGAPGVGKTSLINELRPAVTARRGWFVSGKFDQYQHEAPSAAVLALRALGRLLLAEPDAELGAQRERILRYLGANAGLITAVLPEFGLLLGTQPEVATRDALEAAAKLEMAVLELLRAVVSPDRPVVMLLDDLQWASSAAIRFIDNVLTDESLRGLLLVGTYRDGELDATHPLSAGLPRWDRLGVAPLMLRLQNLPPAGLSELLGEMLRLTPADAAALADAVGERTGGNPYDTVELINALRRDGVLHPGAQGWEWDAAAIRRHVGQGYVVDLLNARIARLSAPSRALLQAMACLGGETKLALLRAATGLPAAALDEALAAPLEDGLLVLEQGDGNAVRFRHDRVQQAAYGGITAEQLPQLHLTLARSLAADREYAGLAAAQYLPALQALHDATERRRVARLFRRAATQAQRSANHATAERFVSAAATLLDGLTTPADENLRRELEIQRHAVLYSLGRLDDADIVYGAIESHHGDMLTLLEATCVQVSSLSNRGKQREAVELGMALLRQVGLEMPAGDIGADVARRLVGFYEWASGQAHVDDLPRPETTDPEVRLTAKLISKMVSPALFNDPTILAWLVQETQKLWDRHGPCAAMLGPVSCSAYMTVGLRQDYRTGYNTVRRALAVGAARGYEPETSQARHRFALATRHWFEPLEGTIAQVERTRESLLHGGDLQVACFTYFSSLAALLDCAPTLSASAAEVEAALAFAARTGNHHSTGSYLAWRQLIRALQGQTDAAGSLEDASFNEAEHLAGLAANPMAVAMFHIHRALAAALFADGDALARHAALAMPMLPYIVGFYPTALAHLLQALSLSERVRAAAPTDRDALLEEFDRCHDWLATRAAEAPGNFGHLARFLDAERAWAIGEFQVAVAEFDAALQDVESQQRPWHQALITERAAQFYLAHGADHSARLWLAQTRQLYDAWGATAKVAQLEDRYPFLRPAQRSRPAASASRHVPPHAFGTAFGDSRSRSASFSHSQGVWGVDSMDLLAVLRASQALSSETSLPRLKARVVELLGAITGATRVRLVLRRDDPPGWLLSADGKHDAMPVEEAGERALLPLTAFRYAERTQDLLLVEDATRDDRFAHDPYLAGQARCSLLLIPILSQGSARAMLLLENTLSTGAFTADGLDAVKLIAGQLAVSLDNALLYASLERKVAERTEALEQANLKLAALSLTDPLTGLANRRRFAEALEAEWQRALRTRASVGLIMIDIDQFKLYNDHYGHLAGDACLRLVANTLRDQLRPGSDLVARYGGEEFVVVLANADAAATRAVAERLRAAVAFLREPHDDSGHGIVTISAGIAAFVPNVRNTPQQIMEQADHALYEAKTHGRNRVAQA